VATWFTASLASALSLGRPWVESAIDNLKLATPLAAGDRTAGSVITQSCSLALRPLTPGGLINPDARIGSGSRQRAFELSTGVGLFAARALPVPLLVCLDVQRQRHSGKRWQISVIIANSAARYTRCDA
jgi:hypothetical protein